MCSSDLDGGSEHEEWRSGRRREGEEEMVRERLKEQREAGGERGRDAGRRKRRENENNIVEGI